MSGLRLVRARTLTTAEQVTAVLQHPAVYELGALIPAEHPVGRPRLHVPYLLVAYGVLARVFRSGIRVQSELAEPTMWTLVRDTATQMADRLPEGLWEPPGENPPRWESYRYVRDRYLTDPDLQPVLLERFTEGAVEEARGMGLLDPAGPGSLTHPHRSRAVYGDGTVVRPLYAPPPARREADSDTRRTRVVYLDAAGAPIDAPARRFDPDAAEFHGHAGPVHGNNIVALSVRGDGPYSRVVLGVDRVDRPGHEADTAVGLARQVHAVAGAGMQAFVYDGALRGVHIDELMTRCGLVVVNKVHADSRTARRRGRPDADPRWFPLGAWEHATPAGACTHTLAAVDGAVSEVGLDEAGTPVVLARLTRRQVKRARRAHGGYHFSVGYEVPCPAGVFLAWVTPHGDPRDDEHRRADAVRVIADGEEDFTRLYGLRNDSESFNSQFKRTLIADRAMSLGWRRQLNDALSFAILNNAVTAHEQAKVGTRTNRAAQRAA